MGLTQASKSLRCKKAFSFSEYSVLRIQNIALEAFFDKYEQFMMIFFYILFKKSVGKHLKSAGGRRLKNSVDYRVNR